MMGLRPISLFKNKYNKLVIGVHNYYNKATSVSIDMNNISYRIYPIMKKTQEKSIELQIPNKFIMVL